MKTTNTFYWTFIDTLIHNVATIAAIVVAVCQFLIRSYNENNGNEKVRKATVTVLRFVNTLTAKMYENLNHDVPPVKVAQKRTKRS